MSSPTKKKKKKHSAERGELAPVERLPTLHRQIYNQMTKPLQQVVDDTNQRMGQATARSIISYFDLGLVVDQISTAVDNGDDSYGDRPIEQLAVYYGVTTTVIYNLRTLAQAFDRKFVLAKTEEAGRLGCTLCYQHWLLLAQIKSKGQQQQLLEQTIKQRLSSKTLNDLIQGAGAGSKTHARAGGRPPSVPASPVAALQKYYKLCQSVSNYSQEAERILAPGLEDIPPDQVSESLLRQVDTAIDEIDQAAERMSRDRSMLAITAERFNKLLAPPSAPKQAGGGLVLHQKAKSVPADAPAAVKPTTKAAAQATRNGHGKPAAAKVARR